MSDHSPCDKCGAAAGFEKSPEGQRCGVCDEWVCNECQDCAADNSTGYYEGARDYLDIIVEERKRYNELAEAFADAEKESANAMHRTSVTWKELAAATERIAALTDQLHELALDWQIKERDADRYQKLRRLTPRQFADMYRENIVGRATFDDLVDAMKEQGK